MTFFLGLFFWSQTIIYEAEPPPEPEVREILTTSYSEIDSCHYPTPKGCLNARNSLIQPLTIACPRDWSFGTKVEIEGEIYTCEDRYNPDLSERIDIWQGYGKDAHERALNYGERTLLVKVYPLTK